MSHIAVTLVLLACLVCPLVEMFDHWDHTVQTGNDTEYTFVLLALCVGIAYSFARFILHFSSRLSASEDLANSSSCQLLRLILTGFVSITPIPLSPPVLAMRI